MLMGARLYNPATGRFLSLDPVRGGNDNPYIYPADPVNLYDLDGKFWKKIKNAVKKAGKWAWKHKGTIALTAAGFVPGLGAAAWAYRGYKAYKAIRAVQGAARSCRTNSFTPDTLVLMADGSHKPLADIAVGDLVVATDPDTGVTADKTVTHVIIGEGVKDLVEIGIDADGDGDTETITATAGHPFYVPDTGWTDATNLEPGEQLASLDGDQVQVLTVDRSSLTRKVYNLTVADIHTYHVIADDQSILVHNCPAKVTEIFRKKNTFQKFASRDKAVARAMADRSRAGRCFFRLECRRGGHVHLDYKNKRGTIVRTDHYTW